MAFHNCASRYLYAMGREGLSSGLQKTLGATHHNHGSPYIASFVQTGITLVLILAFFFAGMDPSYTFTGCWRSWAPWRF